MKRIASMENRFYSCSRQKNRSKDKKKVSFLSVFARESEIRCRSGSILQIADTLQKRLREICAADGCTSSHFACDLHINCAMASHGAIEETQASTFHATRQRFVMHTQFASQYLAHTQTNKINDCKFIPFSVQRTKKRRGKEHRRHHSRAECIVQYACAWLSGRDNKPNRLNGFDERSRLNAQKKLKGTKK